MRQNTLACYAHYGVRKMIAAEMTALKSAIQAEDYLLARDRLDGIKTLTQDAEEIKTLSEVL